MPLPEKSASDTVTLTGLQRFLPYAALAAATLLGWGAVWQATKSDLAPVAPVPAQVAAMAIRVTALEVRADTGAQATVAAASVNRDQLKRLTSIERLLAGLICTQQPQDPERCRAAMAGVGGE